MEVAGSSPLGIKTPFFGIGKTIMRTDILIRSAIINIVVGLRDILKIVFLIFPLFHEYNNRGMDSERTVMMTVAAFIVIFNRDK